MLMISVNIVNGVNLHVVLIKTHRVTDGSYRVKHDDYSRS